MSRDKYLKTNAHGFNHADTAHFYRKIGTAYFIGDLLRLRDELVVGNIYTIQDITHSWEGETTIRRRRKMELIGKYPHHAVFRPVEGLHRPTEGYSYQELVTGGLRRKL